MHKDVESILLSEEAIKEGVKKIADEINHDYKDLNPIFVSILKGSFVFMADLIREITIPCEVDFMAVSSYGKGTVSSGEVRITKDLDTTIEGRHLIFVEDILDSGLTLSYVFDLFQRRKVASIKLCALLNKPDRRKAPVHIDYKAFDIPDAFVVGYGLDYAENYRNLPYVGILKPEIYTK